MSIKSNALGPDDLPIKFLKFCLPNILPVLLHLFNYIIEACVYPVNWKISRVIALPKINDPQSTSDMRPISIVPAISKVFERIIDNQMKEFIHANDLLTPFQSGFRPQFSTTSVLVDVTESIRSCLDKGNCVLMVLLDFTKAFNSIVFDKLAVKLRDDFRFSYNSIKLLLSYLRGRKQFVEIDGRVSNQLELLSGVPQGTILGPLIFSMYINNIFTIIKRCKGHLFADDLQIFVEVLTGTGSDSVNELQKAFDDMNSELQDISVWSKENDLLLNPAKTQAILFGSQNSLKKLSTIPDIVLDTNIIPVRDHVTNLGVILQSNLDWSKQVDKICQRANYALCTLWRHANGTPIKTKILLVKTLVLSHFFYNDILFSNFNCKNDLKVRRIYNSCLRYIFGLRKYDHVSPYSDSIYNCSFKNYFRIRLLTFLHKLIVSGTPGYLYGRLVFSSSIRTHNLIIPTHSTSIMDGSVLVRGASLWNSLENEIKSTSSIEEFKRRCMNFFNQT